MDSFIPDTFTHDKRQTASHCYSEIGRCDAENPDLKVLHAMVVTVNYRLSPHVKAPAYIEDAAAAVAWTFNNIEKYAGSKKKIFVSGHSAGGYLASIVGLDKRWLLVHDIDANQIAGLGPLQRPFDHPLTVRGELGIGEKQPIIDELAPLYHVRYDAAPMLRNHWRS